MATSQAGPQRTAEIMGDGDGFKIVVGVDGSTESRFASNGPSRRPVSAAARYGQ